MIPGPLISWQMLLLLFGLPVLGGVLTLALLVHAANYFLRRKGSAAAFFSWKVVVWCVLVLLLMGWTGFLAFKLDQQHKAIMLSTWYKQRRSDFVLEQDFQYGDLLIPRGSLINRYDPFDNGEPQYRLGLRGLDRVRFARPVQVAGVDATQMEVGRTRLILAHAQRIGPVYHYDSDQQAYVVDPAQPYLDCKAGDSAWFEVPLIDYDIQAEFTVGEPDGADARFKPGQWQFLRCEHEEEPMTFKPAFDTPPPPGAVQDVWSAAHR